MRAWAAVILFFGVGVAIASVAAVAMSQHGHIKIWDAISASCIGGFGAWCVFIIVLKVFRFMRSVARKLSGRDSAD